MRTSLRRTITQAAVAVTAVAVAGSGALVAPAQASTASDQSTGWLARQLDGGLVVSEYNLHDGSGWQSYTDYGLALDVYFAFGQLDTKPGKRRAILDAIEPEAGNYTYFAGGYGKLLTAVEAAGIDPSTYGSGNLVSELEDLVVTSGPETGRAKDPGTDYSNTFGQAYVATALSRANSNLADEAATFLLKQQCAAGFFRENMKSNDFTCDGGTAQQSKPSVDATATAALAALDLAFDGPPSVQADATQSFQDAVAWLIAQQRDNGAFKGNGTQNTNSTGLAASVLLAAGKANKAKKAATWINQFRVTQRLARTTAFKRADIGAVAYDVAAFKAGKKKGITRGARYEWRRSTAQAAPALDMIGR